jgi:hypothetical protein
VKNLKVFYCRRLFRITRRHAVRATIYPIYPAYPRSKPLGLSVAARSTSRRNSARHPLNSRDLDGLAIASAGQISLKKQEGREH